MSGKPWTVWILLNYDRLMAVGLTRKHLIQIMVRDVCCKSDYERYRRQGSMRIAKAMLAAKQSGVDHE